MIYIAIIKKHWYSRPIKFDFHFKENAVDICRKYIRLGYWGKVIEKKGGW